MEVHSAFLLVYWNVVPCVSTCLPQQFWITVHIGLAYESWCNIKRNRTLLAWAFHTVPNLFHLASKDCQSSILNLICEDKSLGNWISCEDLCPLRRSSWPPSSDQAYPHIVWIARIACYVMLSYVYHLDSWAFPLQPTKLPPPWHQADSSTFKLLCVLSRHVLRRWSCEGSAVAKWVSAPTAKAWHDKRRKRCRR